MIKESKQLLLLSFMFMALILIGNKVLEREGGVISYIANPSYYIAFWRCLIKDV